MELISFATLSKSVIMVSHCGQNVLMPILTAYPAAAVGIFFKNSVYLLSFICENEPNLKSALPVQGSNLNFGVSM